MGQTAVELPRCYFPRRYVVITLGFLATTLAYMMRSNLSIAILVMSLEFNWPLTFKGMFLSAFFWGYITTQLIGGMAARKFGPKFMIMFVIVVPSFFTVLVPVVAPRSEALFVICRVLTGVAAGATFPTMYLMLSGWIPNSEKALGLAIVFAGVNIGTILIDTLGPVIMSAWGWPYVFYLSGGAGFIWVFFWFLTVTDTPDRMQNIHPDEIKYILAMGEHSMLLPPKEVVESKGINEPKRNGELEAEEPEEELTNKQTLKILMKHASFWNIVFCGFCTNWGTYIFLTWLPTYLHSELGFDVQLSGIIAITPNISNSIVSFLAGKLCDILLMKGFKKLRVRKMFYILGCIFYTATLVILAFSDKLNMTKEQAAIVLALGSGSSGLHVPGYTSNIYDIAPYHPSLVVGISNTAATIPGIVGVFLTGVLLQAGFGWTTIFLMTASFYVMALISCVFFLGVKRLV